MSKVPSFDGQEHLRALRIAIDFYISFWALGTNMLKRSVSASCSMFDKNKKLNRGTEVTFSALLGYLALWLNSNIVTHEEQSRQHFKV